MAESVVRVQALDGAWETVGADRQAGVWPEGLELSADGWGGKSCTFDLRRDPAAVWPDISAFTPVEVDVEGQLAWSGRVSETPSRDGTDRVMSVVCEGWQHHLDDDLVDAMWVQDGTTGFVDQRSRPNADLGSITGGFPAVATTQVGDGQIVISWPKDTSVVQNTGVGVVLDLGPNRRAKRAVVTWSSVGTDTNTTLFCRGTPDGRPTIWTPDYADAFTSTIVPGPTTSSGNFGSGSGYRFVHLFLYRTGVTATATGNDLWAKISSVRLFTDAAFESGGASVLKASRVVTDVLDAATPLLSSDRSGVTATAFNMPEYAPDGPRTPREHVAAVNAFHGWLAKVDPDRRMIFGALPSRPRFTVGDWSAVELQDAAGNSGQDIYNRVLVTGQDPAGQPVSVVRDSGGLTLVESTQSDLTISNPSFDTNTTGWTGVSLSRTTTAGEFDSGPAGGKVTALANGFYPQYITCSGTAKRGTTYVVRARVKYDVGTVQTGLVNVSVWTSGGSGINVVKETQWTSSAGWINAELVWTPSRDIATPNVQFEFFGPANGNFLFDTITITKRGNSLPDRRKFVRSKQLQVSPTLPSDGVAAATLGDAWLAGHATTPFRGSLNITGPDAIRDRTSGQPVPPHQLLRDTGELIHLSDRVNPDTGGIGRDARITSVTYRPESETATVALDNTRSDLDALLSRLAVVQGAS